MGRRVQHYQIDTNSVQFFLYTAHQIFMTFFMEIFSEYDPQRNTERLLKNKFPKTEKFIIKNSNETK